MTYRHTGKQIFRANQHIADSVSEYEASVIVDALNEQSEVNRLMNDVTPTGPDLFGLNVVISNAVPDDTVQWVQVPGPTVIKGTIETEPPCSIRQYSDQMACATHRVQWDVNDPDPPQPCGSRV